MSLAVPDDDGSIDYQEVLDIEEDYVEMEENESYTVTQQPTRDQERINAPAEICPRRSHPGVKTFIGVIAVIGVVLLCATCIVCFALAFIEITKMKAQLNDQGIAT